LFLRNENKYNRYLHLRNIMLRLVIDTDVINNIFVFQSDQNQTVQIAELKNKYNRICFQNFTNVNDTM
jgi:hypothetical protein